MAPSKVGCRGSYRSLWLAVAKDEVLWEVRVIPAFTSHTPKFKPSVLQANPSGTGLSQMERLLQPHLAHCLPPVCAAPANPGRLQLPTGDRNTSEGARGGPSDFSVTPSTFKGKELRRPSSSCQGFEVVELHYAACSFIPPLPHSTK